MERHVYRMFQFQTGAIKSVEDNRDIANPDIRFNSKLVRLKGWIAKLIEAFSERFNSKLVRLKGCPPVRAEDRPTEFQFQTGAIKRGVFFSTRPAGGLCFNSKLVRLKVGADGRVYYTQACFNSKLVRLKAAHHAGSSKVFAKPFQFQTGAIKSGRYLLPGWKLAFEFQFQTGAIKRQILHSRKRH